MSKSPQYNQKTEPKQCKSEVDANMYLPKPGMESGCHSIGISENK